LKGKSVDGYMEYAQTIYPTISSDKCSYYTKVIGNSKSATVYLFVSTGYQKFLSSSDDQETADNVTKFLQSLLVDVKNYTLELQIAEQEKISKKANDDYQRLLSKKAELTKSLQELDKNISSCEENLKVQTGILNNLKQTPQEKYQ
jgi:hypothetical protein